MDTYIYFFPDDEIFQKFDNYEIGPCALIIQNTQNDLIYEACNLGDPDIAIWCVFGHFQTGGLECISDHKTYASAKRFLKTLPKLPTEH